MLKQSQLQPGVHDTVHLQGVLGVKRRHVETSCIGRVYATSV